MFVGIPSLHLGRELHSSVPPHLYEMKYTAVWYCSFWIHVQTTEVVLPLLCGGLLTHIIVVNQLIPATRRTVIERDFYFRMILISYFYFHELPKLSATIQHWIFGGNATP